MLWHTYTHSLKFGLAVPLHTRNEKSGGKLLATTYGKPERWTSVGCDQNAARMWPYEAQYAQACARHDRSRRRGRYAHGAPGRGSGQCHNVTRRARRGALNAAAIGQHVVRCCIAMCHSIGMLYTYVDVCNVVGFGGKYPRYALLLDLCCFAD